MVGAWPIAAAMIVLDRTLMHFRERNEKAALAKASCK